MAIDYSGFSIPKPEPRRVTKKRQQLLDARNERACREIVRGRDKGRCRIPNCHNRAEHVHHVVYRSHSKARRWDPRNVASLCADHHALVHAGVIQISGNADDELIITGDVDRLRFRL